MGLHFGRRPVDLRCQESALGLWPLCPHPQQMGQLKRLGAITSIPTGDQTKARALVAGLVALAKHTTAPVKVIVQVASVWAAWQTHHRYQPFPDLLEDLTIEDTQRVTVLYVSRNTRTPEAPGNEPQLRRRQRDAALVAWERANNLHDKRQTERQKTVDQDNTMIYKRAIQRLVKIYEDKEHYIHDKAPRPTRQADQTKEERLGQPMPAAMDTPAPSMGTSSGWLPLQCLRRPDAPGADGLPA